MSDLRDWLRSNKFEQYADAFEANDIDLDILPVLSERDLEQLGLSRSAFATARGIAGCQGVVIFERRAEASFSDLAAQSMIRKSGHRFSLATDAEGVCAEIMRKQEDRRRA